MRKAIIIIILLISTCSFGQSYDRLYKLMIEMNAKLDTLITQVDIVEKKIDSVLVLSSESNDYLLGDWLYNFSIEVLLDSTIWGILPTEIEVIQQPDEED